MDQLSKLRSAAGGRIAEPQNGLLAHWGDWGALERVDLCGMKSEWQGIGGERRYFAAQCCQKAAQPVERVSQSVSRKTYLPPIFEPCQLQTATSRHEPTIFLLRSHEKLRLSPPISMGNSTLDNCKLTHGLTASMSLWYGVY